MSEKLFWAILEFEPDYQNFHVAYHHYHTGIILIEFTGCRELSLEEKNITERPKTL